MILDDPAFDALFPATSVFVAAAPIAGARQRLTGIAVPDDSVCVAQVRIAGVRAGDDEPFTLTASLPVRRAGGGGIELYGFAQVFHPDHAALPVIASINLGAEQVGIAVEDTDTKPTDWSAALEVRRLAASTGSTVAHGDLREVDMFGTWHGTDTPAGGVHRHELAQTTGTTPVEVLRIPIPAGVIADFETRASCADTLDPSLAGGLVAQAGLVANQGAAAEIVGSVVEVLNTMSAPQFTMTTAVDGTDLTVSVSGRAGVTADWAVDAVVKVDRVSFGA